MIVLVENPPNFEEIDAAYGIKDKPVVFTYGETIYNPKDFDLDPCLIAHEEHHSFQQFMAGGADIWWKKHISDPTFRYQEELEAYRVQYKKFCKIHHAREKQFLCAHKLALDLSGDMYGKCVSYMDALKAIRS